ncbi:MAG: MarR family transcriptional regulator [Amycolatopsis sp.]|nr:MarR family transcriptional regulator [Amycolatopsis sp.]
MGPEDKQAWQRWAEARPDLDLSPLVIIGALKHAGAMLDLLLEPVFEAASISSSEFDVLFHLHRAEPTIARRLAASMGRSSAALSKALAKLERRGLVERQENQADRRSALVTITDAGAAAVEEVLPQRLALEAAAVGALTDRQRADADRVLRAVAQVFEAAARRAG